MMTPDEVLQLRAVLKLLDSAYSTLALIARPHGQEPSSGMCEWSGWKSDDTADDGTLFWEGRRREK
jgi:hypothetical protein